jgi:dTDP-4-amino-4,6-dideoxygalactose transaminase
MSCLLAFLSSYRGRPVGTFGHFGCFSFHYTKNIICGEGGALCINRRTNDPPHDTNDPPYDTNDPPYDTFERAAVVRDKGTNRTDFLAGKIDRYQWVDVGSSFVLSEASSAILLAQLECAPDITAKRLEIYACYQSALKELENTGLMQIPLVPDHCQHNGHIFCIILCSEESLLLYQRKLKALGIDSFTHYTPLHSSPAGIKFGRTDGPMTTTERVHQTLLRLPIWVDMTYDELNIVTRAVKTIAAEVMDIN